MIKILNLKKNKTEEKENGTRKSAKEILDELEEMHKQKVKDKEKDE